jgi:hypothetical protein
MKQTLPAFFGQQKTLRWLSSAGMAAAMACLAGSIKKLRRKANAAAAKNSKLLREQRPANW